MELRGESSKISQDGSGSLALVFLMDDIYCDYNKPMLVMVYRAGYRSKRVLTLVQISRIKQSTLVSSMA